MKFYSQAEKPIHQEEEVQKKPAPYNWLVLLLIFVAYIVFTLLY